MNNGKGKVKGKGGKTIYKVQERLPQHKDKRLSMTKDDDAGSESKTEREKSHVQRRLFFFN